MARRRAQLKGLARPLRKEFLLLLALRLSRADRVWLTNEIRRRTTRDDE